MGNAHNSALEKNGKMGGEDIALTELHAEMNNKNHQLSLLYSKQQELHKERQALQEEMDSKKEKYQETLTLELFELTAKYSQLQEGVCATLRALDADEKNLEKMYRETLTFELFELTTKYSQLQEGVCATLRAFEDKQIALRDHCVKRENELFDELNDMYKKYRESRSELCRELDSKMLEPLTVQQQNTAHLTYQCILDDLKSDLMLRESNVRRAIEHQKQTFELQQTELLHDKQSLQNQLNKLRVDEENAKKSADAKLNEQLRTRREELEHNKQSLQNQLSKLRVDEKRAKIIAKRESRRKMEEALELEKKKWDDKRQSLLLLEQELQLKSKAVQDDLDKLRDTMQHMMHQRNGAEYYTLFYL